MDATEQPGVFLVLRDALGCEIGGCDVIRLICYGSGLGRSFRRLFLSLDKVLEKLVGGSVRLIFGYGACLGEEAEARVHVLAKSANSFSDFIIRLGLLVVLLFGEFVDSEEIASGRVPMSVLGFEVEQVAVGKKLVKLLGYGSLTLATLKTDDFSG